MLLQFRYTFRAKPGRTNLVQHDIDTGTAKPIRGARFRTSEHDRKFIKQEVEEMLAARVIQPSRSAWGASVVLVPKKDGGTRFCVDYRRLNEITIKDVYPIPRIDATLDRLGGCEYFSALDLTSGYWQVELTKEAKEKTAFVTPTGLYEFTMMPFGLTNAPATFQRLMDGVLASLGYEYCLVYLDDVLIFSRTFEAHLEHVTAVLTCIRDANLSVKLKKCSFAQAETVYLGHLISKEGVAPEPAKLAAVKELLPPMNVSGVRSFLGFVGYYRRFIKNFSRIARPLTNLTKKKTTWEWDTDCQAAFETLRDVLLEAPVLATPDFEQQFIVRTDASYKGLGAALVQEIDGVRRPIGYASRTLKEAETRYSATEVECVGMRWALQQFRPYIHGTKFILETDHVALKWLRTVQHTNSRLIRTAMELQDLDMEIVHRPGLTMHDADALSRLPREQQREGEDVNDGVERNEVQAVVSGMLLPRGKRTLPSDVPDNDDDWYADIQHLRTDNLPIEENQWTLAAIGGQYEESSATDRGVQLEEEIKKATAEDPWASKLVAFLRNELQEDGVTEKIKRDAQRFVVRDGKLFRTDVLYRGGRSTTGRTAFYLWVPQKLRREVMFACHDHPVSGGHLGKSKTYDRVRQRYYWLRMYQDIERWCASCTPCAARETPVGVQTPTRPLPVPTEPFALVSVDVIGPFVSAKVTGNRFVVIYCDHLSRWVEAVPFRQNTTAVMARVLVERVLCRHGAPRCLLSDRGKPFVSEIARHVYRILSVKKLDTAAYRPQSNGLVERFNKTFASMLSKYVDSKHTDWDRWIPYVTFAYNTTTHPAMGVTPFEMLYGRRARLPLDTMLLPYDEPILDTDAYVAELKTGLRETREFAAGVMQRTQQQRERRRGSGTAPVFAEGDTVLVRQPTVTVDRTKKLLQTWSGPFKVLKRLGAITYEVENVGGRGRVVSVQRMKAHREGEHLQAEETDYENHLENAGEMVPGEGRRSYEREGDGDGGSTSSEGSETEETELLQGRGPGQGIDEEKDNVLNADETMENFVSPDNLDHDGTIPLCSICHQPRRGHKCTGRYIPTRQSTILQRRVGRADAGAQPRFGIFYPNTKRALAVFAPRDLRPCDGSAVTSWEEEARTQGEEGNHIWAEKCGDCGRDGNVQVCFSCNMVYHERCLVRRTIKRGLKADEELLCPQCILNLLPIGE